MRKLRLTKGKPCTQSFQKDSGQMLGVVALNTEG